MSSALLLSILQVILGWMIAFVGYHHLVCASDPRTGYLKKALVIGLIAWGAWFGCVPLLGRPDSPPAIAFALLVCATLIFKGHNIQKLIGD